MAKQRFRDVKQGKQRVNNSIENKEINTLLYASVGTKIKAFLTDAFMLLMPIMYLVFYFVMDGREGFSQDKLTGWIYILIPLIIIQTLFMFKSGQTPGYRAYTITLIDDHTHKKPSLPVILFRNTLAVLSLLTLVGWALMFFRKDNKNLHDMLSATSVVYSHVKKP